MESFVFVLSELHEEEKVKTASRKLCAKLSGVLRFKRARAEDESRNMTKNGERRRVLT